MNYHKISSILLYVVLGISVLVVAFFYFGDSLVDTEAYEAKVDKLEAPQEMNFMQDMQGMEADTAVADTTAAEEDTAGMEADTTEVQEMAPVSEDFSQPTEPEVELTFMESLVYNRTDIALIWGYILVVIAAIFALIFPVIRMFTNPAMLVRTLIGLVVVAGVLFLAYSLGSDATLKITGYDGTDNSDPQVLKLVDTGLITTYFILGLALLSILYSEIAKYFK